MNKKQIKDLQCILRSFELNEIVFSNIQLMVEKERFILDEKRFGYENKNTDYWDEKAFELDERIDALENDANDLDDIASSIHNLINQIRVKIGEVENNANQLNQLQHNINQLRNQSVQTIRDPLFASCARYIATQSVVSSSSLQRRFNIGFKRAAIIMDQLESAGIIGPDLGGKPRSILVDPMLIESYI